MMPQKGEAGDKTRPLPFVILMVWPVAPIARSLQGAGELGGSDRELVGALASRAFRQGRHFRQGDCRAEFKSRAVLRRSRAAPTTSAST